MALNELKYFGWRHTYGDLSRANAAPGFVPAALVPTGARDLHFASAADERTDWNVANPTHPTLYIHSEATPATDYISLYHDATSGFVNVASGTLALQVDGTTVVTVAAASVTFSQDVIISSGFGLNVGSATQVTISDGDGSTNLIPEGQFLGVGTAFAGGALVLATFNTTNDRTVSPKLAFLKGAAATQVATTAVADNEVVGSIIAYGSDSGDFETPVAAIEFVVDDVGVPGASNIGGSLEFYTTADGGTTLTLSYTINNDQNIYVANNNGVVVGHTAQIAVLAATPELQVLGTAAADSGLVLLRSSGDATGPILYLAKARDAIGTFTTAITTGDVLGSIQAIGADTADLNANANAAAAIFFVSTGTIAADRIPGNISLRVATDAAPSVLTERVLVTGDGQINFTPVSDVTFANGTGVLVGHTTQLTAGAASEFQVLGTALADGSAILGLFAASALAPDFQFVKGRGATIGSLTIVNDNDEVGRLVWLPADGADLATEAAVFQAEVDDGSPAAGDIGMAFVWESMAGGGAAIAERMRLSATGDLSIANDGGVIIGNATQITTRSGLAEFQMLGTGATDGIGVIGRWSGDTSGPGLAFVKSRNPTIGTSTIVVSQDQLGAIFAWVDDGTNFDSEAASITFVADGVPGTNDVPGRIVFGTTPAGLEASVERVRIASTGLTTFAAGTTPASVASTPGTAHAGSITATGGLGGNTTNASGTGGIGGGYSLTAGAGGTSSGATVSAGGAGGAFAVTTGAGGAASVATVTGTGGNGGASTILTGDGGAVSGAVSGTATGGNAGLLTIRGGVGGAVTATTGTNIGGNGGGVSIIAGAGGNASGATDTGGQGGIITVTPGGGGTGDTNGRPGYVLISTGITRRSVQTLDMADAAVTLTLVPGTPVGTLMTSDVMYIDPNSVGGTENLLLPPEADLTGIILVIVNTAGGAENIVIQNDAGGTVVTCGQNEIAVITSDGTTLRGVVGVL